MHPTIFESFPRKEILSDGLSVYDFIGSAIDASFKRGWEKNILPAGVKFKPGYPALSEWTVDWIACLFAAKFAGDKFNVIELGAGYGQWMVISIMAYKSIHPDCQAHGMALEADKTHFQWLEQHVNKNLGNYTDVSSDLVHAAAGYDGVVNFPILSHPSQEYGASYQTNLPTENMQEVNCLSMGSIDRRFAEEHIDILHVDIQGAEKDLILSNGFPALIRKTNFALFGTHKSDALHDSVKNALESNGMKVLINWPRNSVVTTSFGDIKTNDGAIFAVKNSLFIQNNRLFDLINSI